MAFASGRVMVVRRDHSIVSKQNENETRKKVTWAQEMDDVSWVFVILVLVMWRVEVIYGDA